MSKTWLGSDLTSKGEKEWIMGIHKKVLYGSVRHVEYLDSVRFSGNTDRFVW